MKRWLLVFLLGCGRGTASVPPPAAIIEVQSVDAGTSMQPSADAGPPPMPEYLLRLASSGEVQTRDRNGEILPSRAADNAVLRRYLEWPVKGKLDKTTRERLTIMTEKSTYAFGEEVRVIHVHEAMSPGQKLYVMGPKGIYGEYLDDRLASPAPEEPELPYDGAVLDSPGEDHNYEVSIHRPGKGGHTIQWVVKTVGSEVVLRSNTLILQVR